MAPLWPWEECKALRATVRSEVAKKEFLHDIMMMTCREAILLAAKLGRTERALKRRCKTAYENERVAARTKSILGSRVKKLNAKLFAERKESISLQKVVLDEQEARKHEAKKTAFAAEEVKSAKASIELLVKDLAAEKQRVKKAEEACREKDNAIKAAEQRQKESDSELATVRGNLEEAAERFEELQEEHNLLQEALRRTESTVRDLQQKLEAAEKAHHTLQVQFDTLNTQFSETREQLQAELAVEMQRTKAEMMLNIQAQVVQEIKVRMASAIKALEDKNSVTEQRCTDLGQQLAIAQ